MTGKTQRAGAIGPESPERTQRLWWALRWRVLALPAKLVRLGLPPSVLGWRGVRRETPAERIARQGRPSDLREIHPPATASNPLPANLKTRDELDGNAGWWGYSMRDVPERSSGATYVARLRDIRVMAYRDGPKRNFTVGMIGADGRAVAAPQIKFLPGHGRILRDAPRRRLDRAVWFVERVYDNHSHWLTAHLPKLVLLRDMGMLSQTVLPAERTPAIDASLAMLGVAPDDFPTFRTGEVLEVGELDLLVTDRFRPELLRPVRDALAPPPPLRPQRRIFISRAHARGRHLLAEAELWPKLEAAGFERVHLEKLDFREQVDLMRETAVLVGPHGAGLTNMIFCPDGADIVEIADPDYPNPNFYALASAMGHRYWLLPGHGKGKGHALERDLQIDPSRVLRTVAEIEAMRGDGS